MNVYDFDNTLYQGDSTVDLILYLLSHYPKTWLNLPRIVGYGLGYGLHLVPKQTFKENLYRIFRYVKMEGVVPVFVESHFHKIKPFYLAQKQPDDVIISASPQFTIQAFMAKLGVSQVMASLVDEHSGHYTGLNCHGEEKVRRFREVFPESVINAFYSDSTSDAPLAHLATKAYLVKGDKILPWPQD